MQEELIIIINEQHSLMPQQEALIQNQFPNHSIRKVLVPASGWSYTQIMEQAIILASIGSDIVIVSPIPLLIRELAHTGTVFWLFHNDRREKKELPNGKIISVVAQEGWELV